MTEKKSNTPKREMKEVKRTVVLLFVGFWLFWGACVVVVFLTR